MHIAFVTEKPFIARLIAPYAQHAFPDATLSFPVVWPIGLYGPTLPRGLSWRDYPHIAPFDVERFTFRRGALGMSEPPVGQLTPSGELAFERGCERVEAALRSADRLVVLGSDDSLYHVDVARRMALGEGLAPGEVRPIFALDASAIQTALAGQRPGEEAWARGMVARGQVRRYFDHQFAVNSLAVLGKTLDETAFISKYQLQTLYLLAHLGPLTEGETIQAMAQWTGTGRYAMDGEMDGLGLGTAMSRAAILEQMVSRGWVDQHPREGQQGRTLSLSERGWSVLERLHPGCEDPDLPFRLHLWAERGLGESQGAIDRYIRTFFGRQKRFWEAARRK